MTEILDAQAMGTPLPCWVTSFTKTEEKEV